jgi:predicted nuclease with TOPRIM domain
LDNTNNELAKLQKEVNRERSKATEVTERLTNVDGESKKLIDSTRLEVEAFRQRVFELEKEVKVRDERLSTLEARVVLLSTEIADKDYEIEFYTNSIEELQNEIRLLQSSGAKPSGGQ